MYFSIITDDIGLIGKAISDLAERSCAARIAMRKVGRKWKVILRNAMLIS